jgi:hypothetical protein
MRACRLGRMTLYVLILFPLWAGEILATSLPQAPSAETFTVPKVFHIAGIPGQRRNARLTLILEDKKLVCERKGVRVLEVTYERFRRTQLVSGARDYPEATYIAAVTTFGIGGLLIAKKRKMDVLVLDFVNERGGRMGLVLQLPLGQGPACKEWLAQRGISVEEPEPAPAPTQKP